uniref:Uncharacterized protein n=2 Tax=Glycine max TaxID=3847 RepID=K7KPX0_SOYBN
MYTHNFKVKLKKKRAVFLIVSYSEPTLTHGVVSLGSISIARKENQKPNPSFLFFRSNNQLSLSNMANGSNDKGSSTTNNNNSSIIPNPSSASASSSSFVPNNPRPTANHTVQLFSGTVESFNNYENGSQDFSHATIKSSRIGNSFNNLGSGLQTFRGAEIRCVDKSRSKRVAFSLPPCWKPDRVAHSGTVNSFNNNGSGSQTFDGFKFN